MDPKFEVFPGVDGQFYWHLRSANGQVVAAGAEGFTSRSGATRGIRAASSAVLSVHAAMASAAAGDSEPAEVKAEVEHLDTAPTDAAIVANVTGQAAG